MFNPHLRDLLIRRSAELLAQPRQFMSFTGVREADELLNDIENYPHAYVFACFMDRQQTSERSWLIPYRLAEKLGSFDFARLARLSSAEVLDLMSNPQPLHRFPETMADIFYQGIQDIQNKYAGDASQIWQGKPVSATLVRRFVEFKGAGPKIACLAANMLVRDFKIQVSDKYSLDVSVDVHIRRTFQRFGFISANAKTEAIIYVARELNPEYPASVDLAAWEIGRSWCKRKNPGCLECYAHEFCPLGQREGLDI